MCLQLTCLQWFSNTMRQVSGSAVQGLEGAALRPGRLPGPRGFNLLNQLILDPRERQVKGRKNSTTRGGVPVKRSEYRHNRRQGKLKREEKEKMLREGGGGGGEREEKGRRRGRESVSEQREGGEGGQLQTRCHCQSVRKSRCCCFRISVTLSSL